MLGYCNIMLQQTSRNHRHYSKLIQINRAAERAAGLTSQLLAFSRKQVLEMKVVDLNAAISDMGEMLRRLIGEDIRFVTVLDPTIGCVEADPSQIQQILMNLVLNARDAMVAGGSLTIETGRASLDNEYARTHEEVEPGEYVMIAVSDTGQGMDEATLSRVFDPFFTTKEKGAGTGLGLSTVYGIVRQHRGHVTAYSEPGRGTAFKVYLPVTTAQPQVDPAVSRAPAETGGKETVLIVEDEKAVRELAGEALGLLGYTVLAAASPMEALKVAETSQTRIDLLLTDVVLPGMDGRSLFNKLYERMPDLRVLYMSGYTDNAIVHHGVLDSQVCFLQKPFTIGGLGAKVREALRGQPTKA